MKKVTLRVDLEVPNAWTEREVEHHFQEWLRDLECHYREKVLSAIADHDDAWANKASRAAAIAIYKQCSLEVKSAMLSVRV